MKYFFELLIDLLICSNKCDIIVQVRSIGIFQKPHANLYSNDLLQQESIKLILKEGVGSHPHPLLLKINLIKQIASLPVGILFTPEHSILSYIFIILLPNRSEFILSSGNDSLQFDLSVPPRVSLSHFLYSVTWLQFPTVRKR